MLTKCIMVERLGGTESMDFESFAEFEVQDEDAAASICNSMLSNGEPYTMAEGEHFVRFTVRDADELRRQLRASEASLRSWQDGHGVPEEAQGFLEREV
jgi:hypothetical protein